MSHAEPPLLLHSLVLFKREILGSLEIVGARRIVEIGSESGGFTVDLEAWASRNDAFVVSVDPDPAPAVVELGKRSAHLDLAAVPSPEALTELEPADVYIVDGDHNYATVSAELTQALANGNHALVVLHDVGWPAARRDQYYAPERIDREARHEHSFHGGVKPGRSQLGPDGFRGAGSFAMAEHEGGPRNGVLTAVEDFMATEPGLRLMRVPCIFGVGFLYPEAASWADRLTAFLEPFHENPLLRTMEENRTALYVRVLDLQDDIEAQRLRADRVITGLHDEIGELEAADARRSLAATEASTTPS